VVCFILLVAKLESADDSFVNEPVVMDLNELKHENCGTNCNRERPRSMAKEYNRAYETLDEDDVACNVDGKSKSLILSCFLSVTERDLRSIEYQLKVFLHVIRG
jgi:hypothetical protein